MGGDRAGAMAATLRRTAFGAFLIIASSGSADAQMPGMPEQKEMMAWGNTWFVLFEQLEYSPQGAERPVSLDARSWYGGAYNRIWLRAEGERNTAGADKEGEGELQLLYGKLVDPFWDAVVGLRGDRRWENGSRGRLLLAIGLLGLAPYRFEFEPTVFVSPKGELSARVSAAFPLLLTQRLVLEPRAEADLALQAVPRFGVRKGLGEYELGVRLRYEFKREFAPYVGWSRTREAEPTGDAAGGTSIPENRLVLGLRVWR